MHGDADLLESELRRQELMQQELTEQLQTTREELRVVRADADELRSRLASRGQVPLASEQAEVLYKAQGITFKSILTSGIDRDGQPGDDGISVLILPVDAHGDLVKLVGGIELELLDLAREGDQKRIGLWQFSVDEVRDHWHRGFLAAGYLFKLDWQTPPSSPELTLHGRMTAPDGRRFDSTMQLKVALADARPTAPVAQARPTTTSRKPNIVPAAASVAQPAAPRPQRRGAFATPKAPAPKAAAPKPAEPPGQATLESDRWTEATIPYVR